jgi:ABC-type branched-subunit amino acid transport system substrate-binding protein
VIDPADDTTASGSAELREMTADEGRPTYPPAGARRPRYRLSGRGSRSGRRARVRASRALLTALVVLGAGASFAFAAGGKHARTAASTPINIGIIADRTGSSKTIGDQFINGSEAAAKLFGPIDGRQVHFVVEDGGNFSASASATNVIQLKEQDNAVAVLGFASSECEGAISVANRVQIPMLGNSCSIQDVVGSNCNYWFINGAPSPAVDAKAMAISAQKQFPGLIGKKWVVIGDDPGWSKSVAQYWDAVPGAKSASVQIAPFGTVDWAPYIAKLRASGAKAVLVAVSWGVQYAAFLQQANSSGLFKQMQVVAPVGFPENSAVPGYGAPASASTVAALLKTKVLSQYGGSWTYDETNPTGKAFDQLFYRTFHYPPTTQANVAMADTWMLLSAIKDVGTSSNTLLQKLVTGSFTTPYWSQPLKVQPGGRQLEVPAFATKFVKLSTPQYGVSYANKVLFAMPPSTVVGSASSYGCHVASH